jgi:hypothetical protein
MTLIRKLRFAATAYIHSLCGQRSHFAVPPGPNTMCPKCWIVGGDWSEDTQGH